MRNVKEGYERALGLQFGTLAAEIEQEPLYQQAMAIADGRTICSPDNLKNLYLILTRYLPKLPPGDIIEFGAFKGGSALFMAYIAKHYLPNTHVYALDTFEGMPASDSAIDYHKLGDFGSVDLSDIWQAGKSCELHNLTFVKGRFEDTLPELIHNPFALCHIDCDIRSSVAFAYDHAKDQMIPGGYIVFDDPLVSSCLGAMEVVEDLVIRRDGRNCEQAFPHLVFRT